MLCVFIALFYCVSLILLLFARTLFLCYCVIFGLIWFELLFVLFVCAWVHGFAFMLAIWIVCLCGLDVVLGVYFVGFALILTFEFVACATWFAYVMWLVFMFVWFCVDFVGFLWIGLVYFVLFRLIILCLRFACILLWLLLCFFGFWFLVWIVYLFGVV